jgi:hypothetical protein
MSNDKPVSGELLATLSSNSELAVMHVMKGEWDEALARMQVATDALRAAAEAAEA